MSWVTNQIIGTKPSCLAKCLRTYSKINVMLTLNFNNSESDSSLDVHLKKNTSNPTDFRQTTHIMPLRLSLSLILIMYLLTAKTLQNILLYERKKTVIVSQGKYGILTKYHLKISFMKKCLNLL